MRKVKFRWKADGKIHYRTIHLPDNAQQMLCSDRIGSEVYDGETVYNGKPDGKNVVSLGEFADKYANDYVALDPYELDRTIFAKESDLSNRVYHEAIDITAE